MLPLPPNGAQAEAVQSPDEVQSAVEEYIKEKKKERGIHVEKNYKAKSPHKLARLMGYAHRPKQFDKIADNVYHYLLNLSEKTNNQQNSDKDNIVINLFLFIALLTIALAMFTSSLIRMIPVSGKADAVPPHAIDAENTNINIIGKGNSEKSQVNIGGAPAINNDYKNIEVDISGNAQCTKASIDIGAFDASGTEQFVNLQKEQEPIYHNVTEAIETAKKHGVSIGGPGGFYESIQPAIQDATADDMSPRAALNQTYMSTTLLPQEMNTLRRGSLAERPIHVDARHDVEADRVQETTAPKNSKESRPFKTK